jgi:hypothetical protein
MYLPVASSSFAPAEPRGRIPIMQVMTARPRQLVRVHVYRVPRVMCSFTYTFFKVDYGYDV